MTREEDKNYGYLVLGAVVIYWLVSNKNAKETKTERIPLPELPDLEKNNIDPVTLDGLYWGKVFDPAFAQELVNVSKRLGYDPNDLASIIVLERGLDGDKLGSGVYHKYTDANGNIHEGNFSYGLIGILPGTAFWLGTTPEALYAMSDIEQLQWVEKYFTKHGWNKGGSKDLTLPIPSSIDPDRKMSQFDQIYMGVFYGDTGINAKLYDPLITKEKQPDTYAQHKEMGLDPNNDGKITKKEVLTVARKFQKAGKKRKL